MPPTHLDELDERAVETRMFYAVCTFDWMYYVVISLLSLHLSPCFCASQPGDTVRGCGGFIRWKHHDQASTKVAFNKIKVQLFSLPGNTLKDVTEVLPNGAFSVPVYDTGPYRLILVKPKGWYFGPVDEYIIDIRTDPTVCDRDLNFDLYGFSIYGRVVTFGLTTGPSDLTVRLMDTTTGQTVQLASTLAGGTFEFGPVLPGQYELAVSDGKQVGAEHVRARTTINLGPDSLTLDEPIVLKGHFVRGRIVDFESNPLNNAAVFLLMNTSLDEQSKVDCNGVPDISTIISEMPSNLDFNHNVVCLTRSDKKGQFSFDRLPGGSYVLLPHYSKQVDNQSKAFVDFAFTPPFLHVLVEHTDVDLGIATFRAIRFRLPSGRVTWPNGNFLSGVKVRVGSQETLSDEHGFYQPGYLEPGQYSIQVEAEGARFNQRQIQLTAALKQWPTLQPDMLAICGLVESGGDVSFNTDQTPGFVLISDKSTGVQRKEACTTHDGRLEFCAYTPPGHYQLTLDFRNAERSLHFIPTTIDVNLFDGPVFDLMFTRFRAKLVGRVQCLSTACWSRTGEAPLTPRLIESTNPQIVRYGSLTPVKNEPLVAHFTLDNLLPGDYFIDLVHRSQQTDHLTPVDGWCWVNQASKYDAGYATSNSTRLLHIRDGDLDWKTEPKLDFTQSGYVVRVQLHSQLHFNRLPRITVRAMGFSKSDNTTSSIEWDLLDYSNQVCLPSPSTTYHFTQLNPCLSLSFISTSEVKPQRDCHAQLDQSPLVRLAVTKIPLFVRLAYPDLFTLEAQALLTQHSVPIEVSEADPDHQNNLNVKGKSKIIFANWSTSANNQSFAMASFELDPTHSVRFTPKPVTTKGLRWFYTYLVSGPSSSLFQVPIEPTEATPTAVVSLLVPLNQTDATSVDPDQETCSNLFYGQTTQFTLSLAVVLRGHVEPAVPKVEVELYRTFWKPDSLRPESDQPLLPIDVEKQSVNLSTEPSVVPAHDLPYDLRNHSEPVATTLTNPVGVFLFGPVPLQSIHPAETAHVTLPDPRNEYTVTLRKPGYEFIRQDPDLDDPSPSIWIFKATKLSLVEVVVRTKIGSETNTVPLPDVLVSIIGEGHRGNQFTGPNGVANFVGLAPGQYYLRAMMKEHVFTVTKPEAQSAGQASAISITEGDSVRVEISAERVAFSVSGVVTGLGGAPFEHVLVQATWLPHLPDNPNWMKFSDPSNASCQLDSVEDSGAVPQEQASTDSNGEFRIRGLFPGCYYAIAVRPTPPSEVYSQSSVDTESDNKPLIDQAIPPVIHLVMPSRDATGLSFIAVPQMYISSFTVDVESDDEFVSTLHLTVHPLDRPDHIVAKHDFADSELFLLPPSKMNSVVGRDMVVRLTTSLDPAIYTNIAVQQVVLKPTIDNSVHHTFVFRPKLRPSSSNWPRSEL